MQQHESATPDDDLTPLNLERTSSLDALKVTGTKAVGSLFSRFKVGLKKPLPSHTESLVKTVAKKVKVPEVETSDNPSVRTNAAQQLAPSILSLNAEMQAPAKEQVEEFMSAKVVDAAQTASNVVIGDFTGGPISADPVKLDIVATTHRTVTTSISTIKHDSFKLEHDNVPYQEDSKGMPNHLHDVVAINYEPAGKTTTASTIEAVPSTIGPENEAVFAIGVPEIEAYLSKEKVDVKIALLTDSAENEAVSSTESVVYNAVSATTSTQNEAVSSTVMTDNDALSLTESAGNEAVLLTDSAEIKAYSLPKSAGNKAVSSTKCAQNEAILLTEEAQTKTFPLKFAQDEAHSMSVTITPSTEELPADAVSLFKSETLSPVKSLASRFEGKQEQSLDSLKIRTVRKFFPAERSIRVRAEREKFEAQLQQQQLKTKSEVETKTKYNTGSNSFDEISESGSVSETRLLSSATRTPDAASIRSFDEVSVSSQSFGKFSDEALTPVKSIASRFEGIREQSLDTLKFRTVREFFPDNEQRSIRVGTEKAKFEALKRQQEKAAESAQLKVKQVTSVSGKKCSTELATSINGMAEIASSIFDVSQDETMSSGTLVSGVKKEEVIQLIKHTIATDIEVDDRVTAVNDIDAIISANDGEVGKFIAQADKFAASREERCGEVEAVKLVDVAGGDISRVDDSVSIGKNEKSKMIMDQQRNNADGASVKEPVSHDQISVEVKKVVKEDGNELNGFTVVESVVSDQVVYEADTTQQPVTGVAEGEVVTCELAQIDLDNQAEISVIATNEPAPFSIEADGQDDQQIKKVQKAGKTEVKLSASSHDDEQTKRNLNKSVAEPPTSSYRDLTSSRPMLTTERSFLMDKDDTIKTEDTIVVGERPMTDGEDEFEPVSSATLRPAHELYAGISSSKSKELKQVKKMTTAVSAPKKQMSCFAPAASTTAIKTTAPLKKSSAIKQKSTISTTKQQQSVSKQRGNKSKLANPAPAACTAASIASSRARNFEETAKQKASSSFAKTIPTIPVALKGARVMAPTALLEAKTAAEAAKEISTASLMRSKRYASVKSRVLEGIQSNFNHIVSHKKITKEEFVAAERRKSLGSTNVRSVFETVDRRASLTARASISRMPEQFIRSATFRKKLNSTAPRYMNYENTRGYAERARVQYERRKRLEEANAAKSKRRQRELQVFYTEKQQKSLSASADEVRRGLEAHEFIQSAKDNERQALKVFKRDKKFAAQTSHRTSSATSSAGASSNGLTSRASKRSSVSSASAEEKVVAVEMAVKQDIVIKTAQVEKETISFALVDGTSILEHMSTSRLNKASSDSDVKITTETDQSSGELR